MSRYSLGSALGRAACACALIAVIAPASALALDGAAPGDASVAAGAIAVQADAQKANYTPAVSASFSGADEVTFAGYNGQKTRRGTVDPMTNPTATISFNGSVLAENAAIGSEGKVALSNAVSVGEYIAVISSDNYNDVTVKFAYPAVKVASVGGASYDYLVASEALSFLDDAAKAQALTAYTRIGDTDVYYKASEGTTPLTGTLYGVDLTKATTYSQLYKELVGKEFAAADYDTISSATHFTSHHAGDISPLVARSGEGDVQVLVGAYCTPATVEDAKGYVEASILKAAGLELTDAQKALLQVRLNGSAMEDPAMITDRVAIDYGPASFATGYTYFDQFDSNAAKHYGDSKITIRPKAGSDSSNFTWSDYYSSLYAATIADSQGNVAGMGWWVDLYAEGGHGAVEIAINNGQNTYCDNKATVSRFAEMYDPATNRLKAGAYKVTLYAAGYNNLTYEFEVGAARPSADLQSVELQNVDVSKLTNPTAVVSAVEGNEAFAENVEMKDGTIALSKPLVPGKYRVYVYDNADPANPATTAYTFELTQAYIDSRTIASVKTAQSSYTYTGKEIEPAVTVTAVDGSVLEAGAYTVSYSGNKNVGTATVVVKGVGEAKTTFTIGKAKQAVTVGAAPKGSISKTFGAKAFNLKASANGKGTLTYASSNTKVATVSKAGKVTVKGAGTAKITVNAAATANYDKAAKTVTVKVNKAKQTIKAAKTYTVKASAAKKKAQKISVKFTANGKGKVTYKAAKTAGGKVSIAKNGKVTVKKGTKKGTYTLKVKATAAAKGNYAKTTKTVALKVKVK